MSILAKMSIGEKNSPSEKVLSMDGRAVSSPVSGQDVTALADPRPAAAAPPVEVAALAPDRAGPATTVAEPFPCPVCGSPGFWLSVYDPPDAALRCLACDPPPGRALIRRRLLIVSEPVDPRHPGGPWRRVLEPWEWHFGDLNRGGSGEEITTIVDDTGLGDPQTVAVIAWRYDRLGYCIGARRGRLKS